MAGFQGYQARPYPTRSAFGMPNSGVVQSDPEFTSSWDDKIKAISPTIATAGGDLIQSNENFSQDALSNYLGSLAPTPFAPSGSNFVSADGGPNDAYSAMAPSQSNDHFTHQMAESVPYSYNYITNPEYTQALADRSAAESQRTEAQTRNQQAYDTGLMGNGAIGGVIPSNYSSPTYGQITGQQPASGFGLGASSNTGTVDPMTGLTGINTDPQSGSYTGGAGAYNPNPFAPGSFKNWNGF